MRAQDAAYLAGFLDGDGSIHFQLVRQKEYEFGFYIRASMSFTQSTSARWGLEHLQRLVGGGYLRDRGTGMSDLVVTSRPLLITTLTALEPSQRGRIPVFGTSGRCLRNPKLFEIEADFRRGCRTTSA